jgi:hypothetical protein
MKTFKAINFERNYECTNVKYVRALSNPDPKNWEECEDHLISEDNANEVFQIYSGDKTQIMYGWL